MAKVESSWGCRSYKTVGKTEKIGRPVKGTETRKLKARRVRKGLFARLWKEQETMKVKNSKPRGGGTVADQRTGGSFQIAVCTKRNLRTGGEKAKGTKEVR